MRPNGKILARVAATITITLLFIASSAMAQTYSGQYTVNGSNVTGSGTSTGAYFTGASGQGFDVTIQSGANLSSPSGMNEIQLDHGTVTVQAGANIGSNGLAIVTTGVGNYSSTINNYGTIAGAALGYSIYVGGNGVINNFSGGTMDSGLQVNGNATVNNAGVIDPSLVLTVNIMGNADILNTGTIYDSPYTDAISAGGNAYTVLAGTGGTVNITNAAGGVISTPLGGGYDALGVQVYGSPDAVVNNAGTIASVGQPVSLGIGFYGVTSGFITNSGTIYASGGQRYQGAAGVEIGGNNGASGNIGVANTGTVTVAGDDQFAYGVHVWDSSNIVINNSNVINVTTTGANAVGISVSVPQNTQMYYWGTLATPETGPSSDVAIVNSGTIEASGGSAVSTGIYADSASSAVKISNSGTITGSNYGVYLGGNNSSITANGGTISGGTDAIALGGTNDTVAHLEPCAFTGRHRHHSIDSTTIVLLPA